MPLTPHPEIDALLGEMLAGARACLGPRLVGMILFGSLAAGDFDDASDVDVLFVTSEDVSDAEFAALQLLHDRLARRDTPRAIQFEVSYFPLAALRRYDSAHNRHPRLDRGQGERLHWMAHAEDWVAQRHVIREQGLVVFGPTPASLIDPVSPDDLRAAMRPILRLWGQSLLDDPAQLSPRGYQSFIVLSVCRILYTLQYGAVVSKPAAARWALTNWDPRWAGLIQRALEGRHTPGLPAEADDVQSTLELIRFTLDGSEPTATRPR